MNVIRSMPMKVLDGRFGRRIVGDGETEDDMMCLQYLGRREAQLVFDDVGAVRIFSSGCRRRLLDVTEFELKRGQDGTSDQRRQDEPRGRI